MKTQSRGDRGENSLCLCDTRVSAFHFAAPMPFQCFLFKQTLGRVATMSAWTAIIRFDLTTVCQTNRKCSKGTRIGFLTMQKNRMSLKGTRVVLLPLPK